MKNKIIILFAVGMISFSLGCGNKAELVDNAKEVVDESLEKIQENETGEDNKETKTNLDGEWYGISCEKNGEVKDGDWGTLYIKEKNYTCKFNSEMVNGSLKKSKEEDLSGQYDIIFDVLDDEKTKIGRLFYIEDEEEQSLIFDFQLSGYSITYVKDLPETDNQDESVLQRENTDFRNACWGDDLDTVKRSEEGEPFEEAEDALLYMTSLQGTEVQVAYFFEEGKLVEAGYSIGEDVYSTGGQYILKVNQFVESISEKYGDPKEGSGLKKFETDSVIEMAGEGRALEYGYTAYAYEWDTERTKIILVCSAKNFDISLGIVYSDINYNDESDNNDF